MPFDLYEYGFRHRSKYYLTPYIHALDEALYGFFRHFQSLFDGVPKGQAAWKRWHNHSVCPIILFPKKNLITKSGHRLNFAFSADRLCGLVPIPVTYTFRPLRTLRFIITHIDCTVFPMKNLGGVRLPMTRVLPSRMAATASSASAA